MWGDGSSRDGGGGLDIGIDKINIDRAIKIQPLAGMYVVYNRKSKSCK